MLKRIGTIRAVTTAVATLFVAIALVVGAVGLIAALRHTLIGEVEEVGRSQAREVAQQLEADRPPILEVASSDEQLIQVITPAAGVAASSPNVAGRPAVVQLRPGESARVVTPLDDDEFVAVAEYAQTSEGPRTVVVARALVEAVDTTATVTKLLIAGLPVLLVVVAVTTWIVVGRALAPVEAIRREVDEVSAAQLHRRVPQPDTDDEIGRLAATMNRMLARLEDARNSQRRFVPTPHTSCGRRSPRSASTPRSRLRIRTERTPTSWPKSYWPNNSAWSDWWTTCCCWPAPTNTSRRRVPPSTSMIWHSRRPAALRSTTSVEVDTTGLGAARVHGDIDALRRVLRNLGENAARHASSQIAIAVVERGGDVLLTVDDDGPGIPESERARVLERFVRLDEARSRDEGGSGLGLAIVDEVVRAHGGAVSISRSPLGGAYRGHIACRNRPMNIQAAVRWLEAVLEP